MEKELNELQNCDINSPDSWLCDKPEEININSCSENRIFGNDNHFQSRLYHFHKKKYKGKYTGDMLNSIEESQNNSITL